MNGRQIITLFVIVGITICAEHFDVPANAREYSPYIDGLVPNLFISALLPCLLCQMLPELIAERRSIYFAQMWGAGPISRLVLAIARTNVDAPVRAIYARFSSSAQVEYIGPGDAAAFERLSKVLGVSIGIRTIDITVASDSIALVDASQLDYTAGRHSEGTAEVSHMVKVAMRGTHTTLTKISTAPLSKDIQYYQKKPRLLEHVTIDATTKKEIMREWIFHGSAVLETPIPRADRECESVSVKFEYSGEPLSLDDDVEDYFYFDVTKPTKQVVIVVSMPSGQFLAEPRPLQMHMLEEPIALPGDDLRELSESSYSVKRKQDGTGWEISVKYPPLGSRIIVPLNAMPLPASS